MPVSVLKIASDGIPYTLEEFIKFYGPQEGWKRWNRAGVLMEEDLHGRTREELFLLKRAGEKWLRNEYEGVPRPPPGLELVRPSGLPGLSSWGRYQ